MFMGISRFSEGREGICDRKGSLSWLYVVDLLVIDAGASCQELRLSDGRDGSTGSQPPIIAAQVSALTILSTSDCFTL